MQLTATATDASGNPVSATISWTTANAAVATVSPSGLVTATGTGTTQIRATAGSIVKEVAVTVVTQLNVNADVGCTSPIMKSFRVETESAHLLIASDLENPPGGFTGADYDGFAATFESLVWPVLTENFGTPSDIDGNGKVIAFFTKAVNELTPEGSTGVVGGFFYGRDLFPKSGGGRLGACPASNEAEMFYMLVPDPNGVIKNNVRTVEQVRRMTVGVIGHEFQHLINSARRLYINTSAKYPETGFMEEGLSHIAEELLFYNAANLQPRSNLGLNDLQSTPQTVNAFNSYQSSNFGRFRRYLIEPFSNAPFDGGDPDLATRGAAWSWLRYLADRGAPGATAPLAACAPPVFLAVGASCGIEGAAAASFGVGAGEYAIIAFAADLTAGPLTTTATASGSVAVTGPPNPSLGPTAARLSISGTPSLGGAGPQLQVDYDFHAKLRQSERRELTGRVAHARAVYAQRRRLSPRMYSAAGTNPLRAVSVVEPVWSRLVNSNDTGIVNVRAVFGGDITGATRDWAVANYTDDAVGGMPSQYTHPSWFFRSVYPALDQEGLPYPIQIHPLTQTVTQTMTNGGAAYYRLGVPAAGTSTVRFTLSGGTAPPSNLKLTVVRTK